MTKHAGEDPQYRWYCTACSALVGTDDIASIPKECPDCDYYHCGDMDCCIGEGFVSMLTAKYEKSLASPNENCEICLSIMDNHADNLKDAAEDCPIHSKPGAMKVVALDTCFHGAMFNPNCPVCVERKG